jgi:hypothetical protein
MGFTQILFSAAGSSGDHLSYVLEFGDGAQTTDQVARHACQKQAFLTSRLTVTDRSGRTDSATVQYSCVNLVHLQGVWYSETYGWVNVSADEFRRLGFESHVGARVSGFYDAHTRDGRRFKHFTGTLRGEHAIRMTLDDGSLTFAGNVVLQEHRAFNWHLLLTPQGTDTASGRQLDFYFYDPF